METEYRIEQREGRFRLTRATRVYIAGPYSGGDPVLNIRAAVYAATPLRERGFAPFVSHLSHFWHLITPAPYGDWIAYDNEWVAACDVLLRLPGESKGADAEVALARSLGMPVYHSLDSLCAAEDAQRIVVVRERTAAPRAMPS